MTEPYTPLPTETVQALNEAERRLDAALATGEFTARGIPAEQGVQAVADTIRSLPTETAREA